MDIAETLKMIVRSVEILVGFLMVYGAVFLYEAQERNLKDRLAALWVYVDDHHGGSTRIFRFIQGCADLSRKTLSGVFGEKLISTQSIGVSLCFIFSSLLLWLCLYGTQSNFIDQGFLFAVVAIAGLFLIIGFMPSISRRPWIRVVAFWLPMLPLIFVTALPIFSWVIQNANALSACTYKGTTVECYQADPNRGDFGWINDVFITLSITSVLNMALALLLDVVWISINRWVLSLTCTKSQMGVMILSVTALSIFSSLLFTQLGQSYGVNSINLIAGNSSFVVPVILVGSRLVLSSISLLLYVLMACALIYRLLWLCFGKILYVFEGQLTKGNTKFFGTLGFFLLLHGWKPDSVISLIRLLR